MFLILSLASFGCGEKPRPTEDAPRPAAPSGLAPLSSRDGAAETRTETAPSELPAGHPPIGSHPLQEPPAAADASGSVAGTLDVAAAHRAAIKGGTIFVIARRAGTREVVAVRKSESLELPQKFVVTAADVMMGGVAFTGPFDITARWSASGDAMAGPGDIEGVAKNVAVGASNLKITLSEVRR
jgi:hypothetical protein